jgi:hypothetical protein
MVRIGIVFAQILLAVCWASAAPLDQGRPGSLDLKAVAVDASGRISAVGTRDEGADGPFRAQLVQYSPEGEFLGSQTPVTAPGDSFFEDTAVSDSGDLYAVGNVMGRGTWDFGQGVKVVSASDSNVGLVVKYTPAGLPVWARLVTSTSGSAWLTKVAVAPSGRVVAAGAFQGAGPLRLNPGIAASPAADHDFAASWDAQGKALWIREAPPTTALVVGKLDTLYLAGRSVVTAQTAQGRLLWTRKVPETDDGLNSELTITGMRWSSEGGLVLVGALASSRTNSQDAGRSALVAVRLGSDGRVFWVKKFFNAQGPAYFQGLALGTDGAVLAVGDQQGIGPVDWGPGLRAGGTTPARNAVGVALGPDGSSRWSLAVTEAVDTSGFEDAIAVRDGFVVVGGFRKPGPYRFGNGGLVQGAYQEFNPVILKVGPRGNVLWSQTTP